MCRILHDVFLRNKQEARFDRHFVRDLTWSRHQLEELANRRFIAAQHSARYSAAGRLCLKTLLEPHLSNA
jgi:hypothetical protein